MTVVEGRIAGTASSVRVTLRGGRIDHIERLARDAGAVIVPGLVDVQINGYDGHDVNHESVDGGTIRRMASALWARGVTTFLPTVITAAEERIVGSLRAIRDARAHHPVFEHSVHGAHVEGPHLSAGDGARGAHDAAWMRPADVAEFHRWQEAAGGIVRIVTVAPEVEGAVAYIRRVSEECLVSLGHSSASAAEALAGADAGARMSTHLGNGVASTLPRHPNLIWEQLADPRLSAGFIADGHHLDAAAFGAMVRAKGVDRALLVSDAVALASAGARPGDYRTPVGGEVTMHEGKRLTLRGSELLAGAVKTLDECLSWSVAAGIRPADAVRMASENPAALLGLTTRGRLQSGAAADLAVYDDESAIGATPANATIVAGTCVHRGPSDAGLAELGEIPEELR
ncbi:N-acetylglucosamine-6-phosphate deacetylase [Nonomuraea insulae]|uniref:N-acetylglucosamine-6-phosphate deacetylase n=1 Tax=Nonomuraea insulae TaxID=1616787 RepID=A0ABW1CUR6_9ACTN